jgi:hypothetical protein
LKNIASLCDGFVLIDTQVALSEEKDVGSDGWKPELSPLKEFKVGNSTYSGRVYREFKSNESQLVKDLSTTASLKNEFSVWLTEDSLISVLTDVGFEQVSKIVFPLKAKTWWSTVQADARVLVLAVKERESFASRVFGTGRRSNRPW